MDIDLIESVNTAAEIESSGLLKGLSDKVVLCASNIESKKRWHFVLFSSIWYQACSEYFSMKDAYYNPSSNDLPLLAWRGRNLLELRVWAAYYCLGEQNARRIHEDAGRDGLDLFKAMSSWGKVADQESNWEIEINDADAKLRRMAKEVGIDNLDGTYKAVREAAEECGLTNNYRLQFKIFSKFAHPTAFQLVAHADDPSREPFRDAFFSGGCGLFALTFASLNSYLENNPSRWER